MPDRLKQLSEAKTFLDAKKAEVAKAQANVEVYEKQQSELLDEIRGEGIDPEQLREEIDRQVKIVDDGIKQFWALLKQEAPA